MLAALVGLSTPARADGLTESETERLVQGATVVRPQDLDQGARRYIGGVAYTLVDASADDTAALLSQVDAWRRVLPKTRSTRRVGSVGGDALVEITHGAGLVQVTYTVRLRVQGRDVRFWMDPSRRHDIEDAWGFMRAEPMPQGRTLLTYGVLIDMGPGLLRDWFENRVRDVALTVPDRIRGLMSERNARGARAELP